MKPKFRAWDKESEEKAQRAVNSIGEERIKKYIFGVEE